MKDSRCELTIWQAFITLPVDFRCCQPPAPLPQLMHCPSAAAAAAAASCEMNTREKKCAVQH